MEVNYKEYENNSNKGCDLGVPRNLKHKPIIACNYNDYTGVDDDAKYLSIGRAQYDKNDVSIKIFRHTGKKWSRQSEEVPVGRVADITLLLLATMKRIQHNDNEPSLLSEKIISKKDLLFLEKVINNTGIKSRIQRSLVEIKKILNSSDFDNFLNTP